MKMRWFGIAVVVGLIPSLALGGAFKELEQTANQSANSVSVPAAQQESGNTGSECVDPMMPPKSYAKRFWQEVDFKNILGDSSVLLMPDFHIDAGIKKTIIRYLPQLRAAGITHFIVEMLPSNAHVNSMSDLEIGNFIKSYAIAKYPAGDGRIFRTPIESYIELLLTAKKNGITVRGLGYADDQKDHEAMVKESAQRVPIVWHPENIYMAREIAKILKEDPKARVLAFAGSLHLNPYYIDAPEKNTGISGELIRSGVSPEAIKLVYIYTQGYTPPSPDSSLIGNFHRGGLPELGGDYFLPLPTGPRLPGCSAGSLGSLQNGILYSRD